MNTTGSPQNKFSIYPNPGNDMVTVKMNAGLIGASYVHVFDALGRLIHTQNWPLGASNILLEIGEWSSGMYAVRIYSREDMLQQLPLIKE